LEGYTSAQKLFPSDFIRSVRRLAMDSGDDTKECRDYRSSDGPHKRKREGPDQERSPVTHSEATRLGDSTCEELT